jgi:hypothetical protein
LGGHSSGLSGHSRYTHGHPQPSGPTHRGGWWPALGLTSLHAWWSLGNATPLWPLHSSVVAACLLAEASASSFPPLRFSQAPHPLSHVPAVKVAPLSGLHKETGYAGFTNGIDLSTVLPNTTGRPTGEREKSRHRGSRAEFPATRCIDLSSTGKSAQVL